MARDSRSRSPPPRSRARHSDARGGDADARRYAKDEPRPRDHQDGQRRGDERDRRDQRGGYNDDEGRRGSYRGSRGREMTERDDRRGGRYDRERDRERDRDRDGGRNAYRNEPARPEQAGPSRPPHSPHALQPPSPHARSKSPSEEKADKAKPNFNQSGLLAAATNTVQHVDGTATVLKYNEPPEARKPIIGWRLYVFKGSEQVDLLHVHRQSAYLIGRDRAIADISIDHPSCSKQHAAIQFRQVQEKDEFGSSKAVVKPFIIDLESTNGTHVNGEAIPVSRYYELKASDVIRFGQSTREYVLLHDEV